MQPSLDELTDRLLAFRDAREWRRFHSLKNLMLSVSLESAELLELAQWKDDAGVDAAVSEPEFRLRLAEECADVLIYLLLICERAGIELGARGGRQDRTQRGQVSGREGARQRRQIHRAVRRYAPQSAAPVSLEQLDQGRLVAFTGETEGAGSVAVAGVDVRPMGEKAWTMAAFLSPSEKLLGRPSRQAVVVRLQNFQHFGAAELARDRLVINEHRAQPRSRNHQPVLLAVRTGPGRRGATTRIAIERDIHLQWLDFKAVRIQGIEDVVGVERP